jgi:hypothetical protein
MKKFYIILALLALQVDLVTAQVIIRSDTSSNSAMLDVSSSSKGILIPRMTTGERNSISSPVKGLLIYCTTDDRFYFYNGTAWKNIDELDELQGLTGDVTGTAAYPTISTTISNNAVTESKIANNAVTGAKIQMGGDLKGDILFYNGTDWRSLSAGTSGYVLKTQGNGADPVWGPDNNSGGTVTSIIQGNGMSFSSTPITGAGTINLGTPSTLSGVTLNNVSGSSHTHQIDIFAPTAGSNALSTSGQVYSFVTSQGYLTGNQNIELNGDVTGSGTTSITTTLNTVTIAKGGTGQTFLAANKVLVGNGTGGILQPTNLHWDNTNNRLGINNASPSYPLHVSGDIGWTGTLQSGIVPWARLTDVPNASTTLQGTVQLSNSYNGTSQTLATTEKAVSDGLATKANSSHVHSTVDITSGTLEIARGGTNNGSLGSAGSIAYAGASQYTFSAVGTSGQALVSGGTGSPAWYVPTAGSILFAGTSGVLAQDNTNFKWDDSNNRLGIGVSSPTASVDVKNTNSSGSNQTGIKGIGNNSNFSSNFPSNGSGGAFRGTKYGIYVEADSTATGERAAGYFWTTAGAKMYLAGYRFVNPNYVKYMWWGSGATGTILKSEDGREVDVFSAQSPEIIITDFGTGQLINGKCHIDLDPVFTKNIYVSDAHPLKVFIQLEGDCKGAYVSNKSASGFDVTELQGGKSNTPFSWTATANRADEFNADGSLSSKYVGIRFPESSDLD